MDMEDIVMQLHEVGGGLGVAGSYGGGGFFHILKLTLPEGSPEAHLSSGYHKQ